MYVCVRNTPIDMHAYMHTHMYTYRMQTRNEGGRFPAYGSVENAGADQAKSWR